MADINRIPPNPIIPPVPQERAIEEKKQPRDEKQQQQHNEDKDNDKENGDGGIDYYA